MNQVQEGGENARGKKWLAAERKRVHSRAWSKARTSAHREGIDDLALVNV